MLDFLIIGVQKGGTTALEKFISQHPEICTPNNIKELHFFDNDKLFLGGINKPDYESLYHSSFSVGDDEVGGEVRGEATPIYLYWKPCLQRIYNYNKKIKLIVILRDPAERAFSQYKMERGRGNELLSFPIAIRIEAWRKFISLRSRWGQNRVFSYVDRGFYSAQLSRVLDLFPQDQLLVLTNTELDRNHDRTLSKVFAFLGVDESFKVVKERIFESGSKDNISSRDRKYLVDKYRADILSLQERFDIDCSGWLESD